MLTESAIRGAKPKQKPYKLLDGRGLFLLVTADSRRYWRLRFRHAGRERLISLGVYPDVPLKLARERREDARRQIAAGIDPVAKRRAERTAQADTFKALAEEFLAKQKHLSAGTLRRDRDRLEQFVFPYLGNRPTASIEAPELLDVLKRIEARGTHETAHRTKAICGRVFRYAIATGRAKHDVTADLKGALTAVTVESFPAITEPARVGELLRAIDGYVGQRVVAAALKLLPLVFTRPGELRGVEWSEIDLDRAEWRIPAERMKMRREHLVPLSTQAVSILRELHPITGGGRYVFPGLLSPAKPISDNTLNAALRRLGYTTDDVTAHGFRTTASTLLNEQGWHPDLIELQLAHMEQNESRAAYNRSLRIEERRRMMQAWADYLDGLRAGANVVPLRRSA
jgi:integrase